MSPGDLTILSDKFVKANGRLHDLKKQQTDLEGKLADDYGLEGAFGALVDKCYDAQVNPKSAHHISDPHPHPNPNPKPNCKSSQCVALTKNDVIRKRRNTRTML